MEKFFKLKEAGTNPRTEIIAGLTTFFTMAYIIFVNPAILGQTGMPEGGVFVATIAAAVAGTLVMGLFANVPYAQAPGMGLNAFFTFTVVFGMGFAWQEALALVFICGLINILITVTKVRKSIIKSIPESLQNAISGGIGLFIGYIGLKNANLLTFSADPGTFTVFDSGSASLNASIVPALISFNDPKALLAVAGLLIMIILLVLKVKGAIFIGIIATTILGIPFALTEINPAAIFSLAKIGEVRFTFLAFFGNPGLLSLFSSPERVILVITTVFAFSLTDTFDTIGTFIGTGRVSGIFDDADEKALFAGTGFNSKMDRALFADATATSIGALFGTSNTTTYVESAAGIAAGGRTGLTSVTVAVLFLICLPLAGLFGIVPGSATAPALIVVGVMMMSSFTHIKWGDFEEAAPAFITVAFMAFAYSISYGVAAGFIVYVAIKICKKQFKEVHPILLGSTILFLLNFLILALNNAGIL
ncbi:MAG: NCS2 family permease [Clostridiales bacterium]|jgi:AGZA family xanthine/uracil permease-like MFS transporter|nr:NCS2 family permease [Clostridiales bacterium]